jgi:FKBP-type peptidyl-prolyl cis-trans isomerase 2
MSIAKSGDTVMVHYTGKLEDGSVFDSSEGRDPLQFTIGEGQVIEGFDVAVNGMNLGDTKSIHIPVDQAYGPYRDDLLIPVERSNFPEDVDPEIGMPLQVSNQEGQVFPVMVKSFTETEVILDANHSLAGKDLFFDLELVGIL